MEERMINYYKSIQREKRIFRLQTTETGYELWIDELTPINKAFAYKTGEFKSFEVTTADKKIVYDRNTKSVTAVNCDPEMFREDCGETVITFLLLVAKEMNEYVFATLSDENFFYSEYVRKFYLPEIWDKYISGCMRSICDLNNIERFVKASNLYTLIVNFSNPDFSLRTAKKLRGVVQLPVMVVEKLKKMSCESCVALMQKLCDGDDTAAMRLIDYFYALKNKTHSYTNKDLAPFLTKLINFSETAQLSAIKVANYLAAQNFHFASLGLPVNELTMLVDYHRMTLISGTKFELPSCLIKGHAILAKNQSIIKFPRLTEFTEAVDKYSEISYSNDDFIVRVPESEVELYNEGCLLHHCVASYRDLIIDDGIIVMFLRRKESPQTPFVTIEVDSKFNVVQVKGNWDEDITDSDVLNFISEWKQHRGYVIAMNGGTIINGKEKVA